MVVEPDDRSPFLKLADLVSKQISLFPNRTATVLMGESFGGLLALYVASIATNSGALFPSRLFPLFLFMT